MDPSELDDRSFYSLIHAFSLASDSALCVQAATNPRGDAGALAYFTAGTRQPIEFDKLDPVTYSFTPIERERSLGSYAGIDDFVGALPVEQTYNVYAGLFAGNHDFHHEYIFMLK
ncbi:hypothetical protein L916_14254 [Phytophthora nicotianae]|uniref:Uncharacterized protein n=1 Tax=Phytophthora nicotianae TaxID=4792 RepID=W2IGE8_PHYNI|nr:hypothetical protein L916_14254 [Phytophthora nicotianae]